MLLTRNGQAQLGDIILGFVGKALKSLEKPTLIPPIKALIQRFTVGIFFLTRYLK